MKIEDYFKYYIQGSDHYLIPKDVFIELFNEMSNWKEESKKQKEVIDKVIKNVEVYTSGERIITYEQHNRDCYGGNMGNQFRYCQKSTEKIQNLDNLEKQNKQLKDNWKYIKKMLKEARQEEFNINGYCGTCTDVDIDFLLDKMQELEQGSDSNEI